MQRQKKLITEVLTGECFHTHIYSRSFLSDSNHKPLQMIHLKNLVIATNATLSHSMWHQHELLSWPGDFTQQCAEQLNKLNKQEIHLDMQVDYITFSGEKLQSSAER